MHPQPMHSFLTESDQKDLLSLLLHCPPFARLVNSPDETVLQRLRCLRTRSLFQLQPCCSRVRQHCWQPEPSPPRQWTGLTLGHELNYSTISQSQSFPSDTESAKSCTVPAKRKTNFSHAIGPPISLRRFSRSLEEIHGPAPWPASGWDSPAAADSDTTTAIPATTPQLSPFSPQSAAFTPVSGYAIPSPATSFPNPAKSDLPLVCIDPDCSAQPRGKKGISQHFRKTHLSDKWRCRHPSCHASEFKTEQALKNHFATHKKGGHACAIETCSEVQRSPVRLHACPFDLGDERCYHIFDSKAAFEEHMSRHIQEMSCHELRQLWSRGNAISKFLLYGSLRDAWLSLLDTHYDSQFDKTFPRFSWSPAAEKTILDHLERATLPHGVADADAFVRYVFDASTQRRLDVFPRLPPRPNPALAWTEDDAVGCDAWSVSGQNGRGAVDHAVPGWIEGFPFVPSDLA